MVEPAIEPLAPIRPRVLLNTLIAAALGALLMTALAFLIEYLDDTIKLPEDAARVTGLPALGSLVQYRNSDGQRQLITHENPKSPFSESYRTLRTNIQFSSLDKPINSLMVTSASPGEGKSTTAANLAVVIAQGGKRTILIDTDLRRPVMHQIFGLPNAAGVTNAMLHARRQRSDPVPAKDRSGQSVAADQRPAAAQPVGAAGIASHGRTDQSSCKPMPTRWSSTARQRWPSPTRPCWRGR